MSILTPTTQSMIDFLAEEIALSSAPSMTDHEVHKALKNALRNRQVVLLKTRRAEIAQNWY